jgi:hypothetical protein
LKAFDRNVLTGQTTPQKPKVKYTNSGGRNPPKFSDSDEEKEWKRTHKWQRFKTWLKNLPFKSDNNGYF